MKRTGLTMAAALALLMACAGGKEADMAAFMLKSEAFADGATLPAQFTCDGEDQSPPLSWSEPPQGTKSFALVVDDPDAPSGTFRHWGAFNIPASTRGLPAGAGNETAGDVAQARNDFGRPGYGGGPVGPVVPGQRVAQGNAGLSKDVPPFVAATGLNKVAGLNVVGLRRAGFSAEDRAEIKAAFRLLYESDLNVSQALEQARAREWGEPAQAFFDFVAGAKRRGICSLRRVRDKSGAE